MCHFPRFSIAINGTLVGFFKGAKGLRQGHPLSPYLFVIAMEVFTKLMEAHTRPGTGFQYHPRCSRLNLTHLCFADDLLLFSNAIMSSIKQVKAALLEFESLSGLKSNPLKSSLFCSGISDRLKSILLDKLQMKEGILHLRVPFYLL